MKMLAARAVGWLALWLLLCALPVLAGTPFDRPPGHLVTVPWLQQNLGRPELLLLDASPRGREPASRIPGAVAAELFSFGPREPARAQMQQLLQSWGISPGRAIVIVDEGGSYQATRLFWDLLHQGVPAQDLFILDGGMAKWKASGGALSQGPAPKPPAGTAQLGPTDPSVRVRLPEFLAATADPEANVMLEALDPDYFYGGAGFFNRPGHVPHAKLMPSDDFFNDDKTFKSAPEIARMLDYLGVRPEQQVLTYCGGGGAAAVPFFALKYLLGYPRVRMFAESQMGWLQDPRELPVWTYAAPQFMRDTPWVKAWASPMLKSFGLSTVSLVDVRPAEVFRLGHLPLAVNLPALALPAPGRNTEALKQKLAQAGVLPSHEAVVVSEGGLNERSALAFVALERAGLKKVSIYLDSVELWAEKGLDVARPTVGQSSPVDPARPDRTAGPASPAPLATSAHASSATRRADPLAAPGLFPVVLLATGLQPLRNAPPGRVLYLPYTRLLNADGRPKAASEIWNMLDQAGVPRYAEVQVLADAPGEAAMGYVLLRLMGWPDVKVVATAR